MAKKRQGEDELSNQGASVPGEKQPDSLFPELSLVVVAEEVFQVRRATALFGIVCFCHRVCGGCYGLGEWFFKGALQELEVAAGPSKGGHEDFFSAVTAGDSVEREGSLM